MQFHISPEERRVTVSRVGGSGGCAAAWGESMKAKASSHRRFTCRSVLATVLIAGVLLPFLFIRAAFLALDAGASVCPSIGCLGWRIGPRFLRSDSSLEIVKELQKVYLVGAEEGMRDDLDPQIAEAAPESLDDLISEMGSALAYQHLDVKTFALRIKAMLLKMDHKLRSARFRATIFRHLASIGIPKSMNCLSLRLAEEYLVNAGARSSLPPPEYTSRINNASHLHIALITDNVLAASVAVSSTITSADDPENLVFHVVTDKKTYTAMHAWFALHSLSPAIVEVRGLHQFNFDSDINAVIEETAEEINRCLLDYRHYSGADEEIRRILALQPSTFSLLNYLRNHLPELFPKLNRVIFLDDDVVVRRDLTPLWDLHLNGNVIGAVITQEYDALGNHFCTGKRFLDYLNFSNPMINSSLGLSRDQCVWLEGMNVVDLQAWRRTNITQIYTQWLKLNRESRFSLWPMGTLPPALIAFNGKVQSIEASWHLSGLGWRMPGDDKLLNSAAVLHFSGLAKPWLEIAYPELRQIWRSHLNQSDEFLSSCKVV